MGLVRQDAVEIAVVKAVEVQLQVEAPEDPAETTYGLVHRLNNERVFRLFYVYSILFP